MEYKSGKWRIQRVKNKYWRLDRYNSIIYTNLYFEIRLIDRLDVYGK